MTLDIIQISNINSEKYEFNVFSSEDSIPIIYILVSIRSCKEEVRYDIGVIELTPIACINKKNIVLFIESISKKVGIKMKILLLSITLVCVSNTIGKLNLLLIFFQYIIFLLSPRLNCVSKLTISFVLECIYSCST